MFQQLPELMKPHSLEVKCKSLIMILTSSLPFQAIPMIMVRCFLVPGMQCHILEYCRHCETPSIIHTACIKQI